MKVDNNKLRSQMIREEKQVEASKFKLIDKKSPFLPNLHEKDIFKRHTSIELGS